MYTSGISYDRWSSSLPVLSKEDEMRNICQYSSFRSKILVCHDMKGNYLQDKWENGSTYCNAFQILHWDCIDVFCYFSHCFVTVPPLSWCKICESNRTPIIGTVITEWDKGLLMCSKVFSSDDEAKKFAYNLVYVAKCNNLHGWLINIENSLVFNNVSLVGPVLVFLKSLTAGMREWRKDAIVLWYDAVTVTGELVWQNGLNERNQMFVQCCTGMFVNYTWSESSMAMSTHSISNFPENTLQSYDLFFGIDVFGRNMYGGGGWNCNLALDKCLENKFSAALFAPGWIIEEHSLCSLRKQWVCCDDAGNETRSMRLCDEKGCRITNDADVIASDAVTISILSKNNFNITVSVLLVDLAKLSLCFLAHQSDVISYTVKFWEVFLENKARNEELCGQCIAGLDKGNENIVDADAGVIVQFSTSAGLFVWSNGQPRSHSNAKLMWIAELLNAFLEKNSPMRECDCALNFQNCVGDCALDDIELIFSNLLNSEVKYGHNNNSVVELPIPYYDLTMQGETNWDPKILSKSNEELVSPGVRCRLWYTCCFNGSSALSVEYICDPSIDCVCYTNNILSGGLVPSCTLSKYTQLRVCVTVASICESGAFSNNCELQLSFSDVNSNTNCTPISVSIPLLPKIVKYPNYIVDYEFASHLGTKYCPEGNAYNSVDWKIVNIKLSFDDFKLNCFCLSSLKFGFSGESQRILVDSIKIM